MKAWCKRHILRYKSFEIFSQIVLVLKVFWSHSFSLTIYLFPFCSPSFPIFPSLWTNDWIDSISFIFFILTFFKILHWRHWFLSFSQQRNICLFHIFCEIVSYECFNWMYKRKQSLNCPFELCFSKASILVIQRSHFFGFVGSLLYYTCK